MKYAVIQTGGKQYRVSEGEILEVEHLAGEKDQNINFDQVLLIADDGKVKVGTPFIENAKVQAKIVEHLRGDKIRVAKYKAKVRYRKVYGHRQELTKILIESIEEKGSSAKKST